MSDKRHYRMKARAESQEATRRRIVEATMWLHEHVGPKNTTISAIAQKAGVQRLTVYRHFPDETAVFQACTSLWLELNPPPDPAGWAEASDGRRRLHAALSAFYDYYSHTAPMWTASFRDLSEVPALQQPMAEVAAFLKSVGDDLAAHIAAKADGVAVTIHHGLDFRTWSDLDARGLGNAAKIDLVGRWIEGAAGGSL